MCFHQCFSSCDLVLLKTCKQVFDPAYLQFPVLFLLTTTSDCIRAVLTKRKLRIALTTDNTKHVLCDLVSRLMLGNPVFDIFLWCQRFSSTVLMLFCLLSPSDIRPICHSFAHSICLLSDSLLNYVFHTLVIVCNNLLSIFDSTDILIQIASPFLPQGLSKDSRTSKICKSKKFRTVTWCETMKQSRRIDHEEINCLDFKSLLDFDMLKRLYDPAGVAN